jgi:hypothetical protein
MSLCILSITVCIFRIRNTKLCTFFTHSLSLGKSVVGNSPKTRDPEISFTVRSQLDWDHRVKAPKPAKPDGRGTASRRRAATVIQTAMLVPNEYDLSV